MPEPPCFNALNRLMPLVRAEAARRLLDAGLRQERVAEHLGVSQAMVSKYTRAKPGTDPLASAGLVRSLVEASVKGALEDEGMGRVSAWCRVCTAVADSGLAAGSREWPGLSECARGETSPSESEARTVLGNLAQAETRIRRLPFVHILPQVRSNLAMSLPRARTSRDVAAFPGRFIEVRGQVRSAAAPEFGASSHLASLLLKVRRTHPDQRALVNVRHDEVTRRAARAAGLRLRSLKRSRGELVVALRRGERLDALVDPGAFGVEPALYLVGANALEVVSKVERILPRLTKESPT